MKEMYHAPDLPLENQLRRAREKALAGPGGTCLFIACFPKSASTYLVDLLHALTGFLRTNYVDVFRDSEQNLYLPRLIDQHGLDTVTHQHVKATNRTLELMHDFGIRPVVLVRDIHDVIASLYDHFHNESHVSPFAWVDQDWLGLPEETKLDALIDMAAPWLVQFYASWAHAERRQQVTAQWLSYEQLVLDKPATLQKLLRFHGITRSGKEIAEAIQTVDANKAAHRFNKGIIGRGKDLLSTHQQKRIAALTRSYPWANFSLIGID